MPVEHQADNFAGITDDDSCRSTELWPVVDLWELAGCVFLPSFAPVDIQPGINPLAPAAFAASRRLALARSRNIPEVIYRHQHSFRLAASCLTSCTPLVSCSLAQSLPSP